MADAVTLPVNRVFDVAIVGAGLCGLALARQLIARGLDVQVIEARERLGGRVYTEHCEFTGQALDLGPTWFWPDTEPRITALLTELGLTSQPQHDPGDALWLTDPNREPERRSEPGGVHVGACRIEGGAVRLVEALAAALPHGCVHTGVALQALRDRGTFIELLPSTGNPLRARQVVLALPPRLVHEKLQFDPLLPAAVGEALAATPTWMAAQAKSVTTFAQPFWRTAGHSGNAFVRHAQAVLGEVFDASAGDAGALGGFITLNAAQRKNFKRGLPLLIDSQLAQLFGPEAQDGHPFRQDWADEPWTCSATDRANPPAPPQADPVLRQPLWASRLFLGGSETAAHGAGHMEGALEAADRIAHALARPQAGVDSGRHALTSTLLAPFEGWNKGLLDAALCFNATSCALSNFAAEHQPDAETLRAITLDLAAAWRELAFELNTRLLVAWRSAAIA